MTASRRTLWHSLLLLLGLAGCDGADGFGKKPAPVPDQIDRFGPLELVTHTRAYRAGDSGGWGQTSHWSLRFNGTPVVIETRGGMFADQPMQADVVNAVFLLTEGEQPELIVNVGDPNNTSAFHRVFIDAEGRLQTPLLCTSSGGDNSLRAIDAEAGADAEPFMGPQRQRLTGARWWLLGSRCIYDRELRTAQLIPAAPYEYSLWSSVKPLGLSPDGRSLARFGSLRDEDGNDLPQILVVDLVDGRWSALPVDRQRMRYGIHEALDRAWLDHHFEWSTTAPNRLHERADFTPLPWRGFYLSSGGEYRMEMMQPGHAKELAEVLRATCGGTVRPHDDSSRALLDIEGNVVEVYSGGFYVGLGARPYYRGEPGDPEVQRALVRRLGDALEQALASGRYEHWFTPTTQE